MNAFKNLSIKSSFRLIQMLILLLLIFLLVQGIVLWRVCQNGTAAISGLEKEGLPSLRLLASLQENLAIYRLHSYELMFAQESARPAKLAETTAVQEKNASILAELNGLYPAGEGHQRVAALEANLSDYVQTMGRIRTLMDKDFEGATKILDQEVPQKVKQLNASAELVKEYCTTVASQSATLTVTSFGTIRQYVLWLGLTSVIFAAFAVMLITLNSISVRRALNNLVGKLGFGSEQVNNAASQVASASRTLAQGSGEQAASLEETSSSLEEMSSMTKRNAENAQKANDLAKQARVAADKGATDMQTMNSAMEAIKISSDDIAKIIKTIDEIAFQTNILALNAAVEAARAGEAGMGFAVVADEVRNLAQRSATAAKETAAKIEGAISKTGQGVEISRKVSETLNEIVTKARQVDELAAEVAGASREQTQGIMQINTAVGQMDKVTQSNAASAEESAAAAEELNAQAETMKQSVLELLQLVGGQNQSGSIKSPLPAHRPKEVLSARAAGRRPVSVSTNGNGNGHARTAPTLTSKKNNRHEIPLEGDFRDF